MKKTRIGIIDSGIDSNSKYVNMVHTFFLLQKNKQDQYTIIQTDPFDSLGHGSSVAEIIADLNPNVELYCFCLSEQEGTIDEAALIYVLNYIYQNVDLDLINISLGCTYISDYNSLKEACRKLRNKGVILVSAMDNDGSISFPAALDEVIGVDINGSIKNRDCVQRVENSIVDVYIPNIFYRTHWKNKTMIVFGSSFASARVTGLLSQSLHKCPKTEHNEQILKIIANEEYIASKPKAIYKPEFSINKAIVFPINKESKSVLLFSKLLSFSLVGAFDERLNGNVGKQIGEHKIASYTEIDWESDFDTIILSCTEELSNLTGKDYKREFIDKAKTFGKNIYSFENLPEDSKQFYYPFLQSEMIPYNQFGKLYHPMIPVVGIMGTSSKQGKYTLQLELLKRLREKGYNTGFIATEPSGYLFDADYVFHFGYHANLNISPYEMVLLLNQMVWNTQLNERDIVFAGCQSNTIHYVENNIQNLPIDQYAFLLGIQADAYIVCVNPHDDMDYINRTIQFINSIDAGKVLALVVFPIKMTETHLGQKYQKHFMDESESKKVIADLENKFGLPVYALNNIVQIDMLSDRIINYFAEEE